MVSLTTAVDIIWNNPPLQEHWIRRFVGFVFDAVIIAILAFVASLFLPPFRLWDVALGIVGGFLWGVIAVPYFIIFEALTHATPGKAAVSLRVARAGAQMGGWKGLLRNVTKLHWALLLLDAVAGFVTRGDPRQKFMDRVAATTVTRVDRNAYLEEQFREMQEMPHPYAQPKAVPEGTPLRPSSAQQAGVHGMNGPEGWPGQGQPLQRPWPKHEYDEEGKLLPEHSYCGSCGGRLLERGDGKRVCTRCGITW